MGGRLRIARLVRPLALGSSLPWLAQASDDSEVAVKFAGGGDGPYALMAGFVAGRLASVLDLPVPRVRPIWLPKELPRAGTDEFWDVLDNSRGWNLAVDFVADSGNTDLSVTDAVDDELAARIAWLDVMMRNVDRSVQSRNVLRDPTGALWLIDHGSCLWLRDRARPAELSWPANHFLAERDLGALLARFCPAVEQGALREALAHTPATWLAAVRTSADDIAAAIALRSVALRELAGGA